MAYAMSGFWTVFDTEPSRRALLSYLDGAATPYDEIRLMLFSHGVESAGLASIPAWEEVLDGLASSVSSPASTPGPTRGTSPYWRGRTGS
jgi:hypothetical protein